MRRQPRYRHPVWALLLAGLVLAGCGSAAPAPRLSTAAATSMRSDLSRLEAFAAAGDPTGATREIDAFAALVAREHAAGRLVGADYTALEAGVARTRARIVAEVAPPAAAGSTTPPPAVATPPAAAPVTSDTTGTGKGKDKGKGHGKDGGGGNGNGGD
ncbi:MAG: hypothetical protein ACR2KV_04535 [Solirubrobacteraceae bacterium]